MTEARLERRVFISSSLADMSQAREIAQALTKSGVKSWLPEDDIQPGENWQSLVEEALRGSPVVILLLTEANLTSPTMYFELGAAVADGKKIIPVALGDTNPNNVPTILRRLQWVRASTPEEAGAKIARAIGANAADAAAM